MKILCLVIGIGIAVFVALQVNDANRVANLRDTVNNECFQATLFGERDSNCRLKN